MLKQRLLTAAVLIPLVVLSLLLLPTAIFQWLLAGVTVLAAWEWFSIIGFRKNHQKITAFSVLGLLIAAGIFIPFNLLLILGFIFWAGISILVSYFAHKPLNEYFAAKLQQPVIALLLACLSLAFFFHSAVGLHQSSSLGPQQLLYVMVLVWLADTGGYFAGKRWGKHALAKAISPNKTWQGVGGAMFLGLIWALLGFWLAFSGSVPLIYWLVLSLVALKISIIGDLFESLFKRGYQVKDSGNLLPGHGGMLDRIDSLIAAVPIFTAGLYILEAL